jgi:hypothetical protein
MDLQTVLLIAILVFGAIGFRAGYCFGRDKGAWSEPKQTPLSLAPRLRPRIMGASRPTQGENGGCDGNDLPTGMGEPPR